MVTTKSALLFQSLDRVKSNHPRKCPNLSATEADTEERMVRFGRNRIRLFDWKNR